MLTPFIKPKNEEMPAAERRFNYFHSLTRGTVERALGLLKTRFRWMLRGIHLRSPETYGLWFLVSCILHNMCIDAGEDPDVIDAEADDSRYGGLATCTDFTEAIREALRSRTQIALDQAVYGTGEHQRRRKGRSTGTDTAPSEDVPDPTGEDDTRPANEVMLDTLDGATLRRVIFDGLHLTQWAARRRGPVSAAASGTGTMTGTGIGNPPAALPAAPAGAI